LEVHTLIGFMEIDGSLHAILQQPFIEGVQASLDDIRDLLSYNGFEYVPQVRENSSTERFGSR